MEHTFEEEQVQNTADDAILSKISAAKLGYFNDEYIGVFGSAFSNHSSAHKRSPLINRGYYSRVAGVQEIIDQFLHLYGKHGITQIVSLGGGFDTTYFRRLEKDPSSAPTLYIELDYERVCRTKANIIRKNEIFTKLFSANELNRSPECSDSELHCGGYHLLSADLRYPEQVQTALEKCNVDWNQPILFLSECVLVYMHAHESSPLINWISSQIHESNGMGMFVIYEQIRPDDPFGRVMVENLQSRGCPLLSLSNHPSLESQEERFKQLGWTYSHARDMNDIYLNVIPTTDRLRAEKLEMFDEFEEWFLIQAHYCICVSAITSQRLDVVQDMSFFQQKGTI